MTGAEERLYWQSQFEYNIDKPTRQKSRRSVRRSSRFLLYFDINDYKASKFFELIV